ncbi:MAG TPA: Nif3-like dinuclear metal center hexameric protein [Thermoleophilaceae bacterium]|nr:Nif3-like dinuclear metal center hexameric protein [Thermoleophilaceae bacterium]
MADRDELIAYLDDLLDSPAFDDYGPNGLQVPGAQEVRKVASGVSAHRDLFARAAQAGAQMVLCHHGIIWGSRPQAVTPAMRARLEALFSADMSLAAYHLPLDAHPEHGNNALICEALGFEATGRFAEAKGRPIGFTARSREGVPFGQLHKRCAAAFGQEPFAWASGPETVHTLGVVSGGGDFAFGEAIGLGLDAFVTGEPSEPAMADSREAGVHFVAGGHYATETLGVRRLGELLADRFGVEHEFLSIPNPV